MNAYLLIQAHINDPVQFSRYTQVVPDLVQRFGGCYRVLGGKTQVLEGEWSHPKLVISEWPDVTAALNFWNSPEYREACALRKGAGQFTVVLVEGCQQQILTDPENQDD